MIIIDFIKDCIKGFSEGFFGEKRPSNIIIMTSIVAILIYILVRFPHEVRDDSDGITATCTVTKAYTRPRGGTIGELNDTAPVGVFETEECGTHDVCGTGRSEDSRVCCNSSAWQKIPIPCIKFIHKKGTGF